MLMQYQGLNSRHWTVPFDRYNGALLSGQISSSVCEVKYDDVTRATSEFKMSEPLPDRIDGRLCIMDELGLHCTGEL
jgi:hypothetical protein